jgi:hypothetical protein
VRDTSPEPKFKISADLDRQLWESARRLEAEEAKRATAPSATDQADDTEGDQRRPGNTGFRRNNIVLGSGIGISAGSIRKETILFRKSWPAVKK